MGTTIATIELKAAPMPVDAFAMLTRALIGMPVIEHWDPESGDHFNEPLGDERQLLMGNTDTGGFKVSAADGVEQLAHVFNRGHFEIRWVDHG